MKKTLGAAQRRQRLLEELARAGGPVSAAALAGLLGVSRQIVVGDVALLRAGGEPVQATPRGYCLGNGTEKLVSRVLACRHEGGEALREELYCVVDQGGILEDVTVENPLYGELTGRLHIASRYEADLFLERAAARPQSLLAGMTEDRIHLHTILARDTETLDRVEEALARRRFLCRRS